MFWLPMAVLIALEILMKVGYAIQITALVKIPPCHILVLLASKLEVNFSTLHMEPLGTLELMLKDLWNRQHDSFKVKKWTILWRSRLFGINIILNFMQY